jgi:hypothetical protein
MWNPDRHPDEENLRWAWLRAIEWKHWPLFFPEAVFRSTARAKAAQIGVIQRRLMGRFGYSHTREV